MVIYLCMNELSKGGYKTCLISCRKKRKNGDGGKQASRFLQGIEDLMLDEMRGRWSSWPVTRRNYSHFSTEMILSTEQILPESSKAPYIKLELCSQGS